MATVLNNLAGVYYALGRYGETERFLKRALTIREQKLGQDHPDVAQTLNNLALLSARQGRWGEAWKRFLQARESERGVIFQALGMGSQRQQLAFMSTLWPRLEQTLALADMHLRQDPKVVRSACELWLERKGLVLEAQRRLHQALATRGGPRAQKVFARLCELRGRLARLSLAGPGKQGPEAWRKQVQALRRRCEELEGRLASLSRAYALERKQARATVEQVAAGLPAGSALVDLAKIRLADFKAMKWLPAHYLAFVVPAGRPEGVRLVDLGPAEAIDQAVARFREVMERFPQDPAAADETQARRAGRRLFELVFAPLQAHLGGVRRVLLAPDGQLNLVPFEAFCDLQGRYLIQSYTFSYLNSGREVVRLGQVRGEQLSPPVLMGDPDFDLDPSGRRRVLARLGVKQTGGYQIALRSLAGGGLDFLPLPQTRREVEELARLLGKARVYTGRQALEEVLAHMPTPRILHLATHGFFLPDQPWDQAAEQLGGLRGFYVGGLKRIRPAAGGKAKGVKLEDPLVRSGLALAGANRALKGGGGRGLLTAGKVLGLPLWGTELVVLSACDTGRGEVKRGEGVFGLRRCILQAGAQSLVMSLWRVSDRESRELMAAFYRNVLQGMDRCQALRKAALAEMAAVEKRHGTSHPFFWSAFVFLGDPGGNRQ